MAYEKIIVFLAQPDDVPPKREPTFEVRRPLRSMITISPVRIPKDLKDVIRAWLSFSARALLGECHCLVERFEQTEAIDGPVRSHVIAGKR